MIFRAEYTPKFKSTHIARELGEKARTQRKAYLWLRALNRSQYSYSQRLGACGSTTQKKIGNLGIRKTLPQRFSQASFDSGLPTLRRRGGGVHVLDDLGLFDNIQQENLETANALRGDGWMDRITTGSGCIRDLASHR